MKSFEPGSTIGMFGSGQLGRMFSTAAKQLGYRVHVYSPDQDSPAGQVSDLEILGEYDDLDSVKKFCDNVDVVTLEFENIPVATLEVAERQVPVRPGPNVLQITQHRRKEKGFLCQAGLPVPSFRPIRSADDARDWPHFPAILKTARCGYDGKGQVRLNSDSEFHEAWSTIGHEEAILEELVDFGCELSVVAARGAEGQLVAYEPFLNQHRDHILDVTFCPSGLPQKMTCEAVEIAEQVLSTLDVVGVMCVEFFCCHDGRLLINELAPRPHNSGHLTIEAHRSSQFEQQVRAVCGLPLGSTEQLGDAAMVNLLGELWNHGALSWKSVLQADAALHLYGKKVAKRGRKMGHMTSLASDTETAANMLLGLRSALVSSSPKTPRTLQPTP